MKRKLLVLVGAFMLLFSLGLGATNHVEAKSLPYKYYYNKNKFTGAESNGKMYYKTVASNKYVRYTTHTIVGPNGWNYNR